jgi:hypothetical protein
MVTSLQNFDMSPLRLGGRNLGRLPPPQGPPERPLLIATTYWKSYLGSQSLGKLSERKIF